MREKMTTSFDGGRAKQPIEINEVEIRKRKKEANRKRRRNANRDLKNIKEPDELYLKHDQSTGWDIT